MQIFYYMQAVVFICYLNILCHYRQYAMRVLCRAPVLPAYSACVNMCQYMPVYYIAVLLVYYVCGFCARKAA